MTEGPRDPAAALAEGRGGRRPDRSLSRGGEPQERLECLPRR